MSAWRIVIEDDVLNALNAAELAAFRRVQANADGSDGDVLPDTISSAVMEARGRIAACKNNSLAEGETVPEVMIHHVVAIIRYRLLSRLGVSVKEGREQEYKDARKFLEDVARCQVAIPSIGGDDDTTPSWPKPSISGRPATFKRRQQDGI